MCKTKTLCEHYKLKVVASICVSYFVSLALHFQPCSLPCYYLHITVKREAFKIAATVIKNR